MEPPAWILKNAMKVLKVALMEDLSAISLVTLLFMHIKGFHGLWKYAIDKIETTYSVDPHNFYTQSEAV